MTHLHTRAHIGDYGIRKLDLHVLDLDFGSTRPRPRLDLDLDKASAQSQTLQGEACEEVTACQGALLG